MYCKKCGKEINKGAKFCRYCGATQGIENKTNNIQVEQSMTEGPKKQAINKKFIVIGIVVLSVLGAIGVMFNTQAKKDPARIEEAAIPLVNKLIQEKFELNLECDDVTISKDNGDNTYEAKAIFKDGNAVNINVEYYPKKDQVYVEIPYSEAFDLYY